MKFSILKILGYTVTVINRRGRLTLRWSRLLVGVASIILLTTPAVLPSFQTSAA